MTLQEAKKVIGLNIHKLNGSMQQAVALLMDKEEEEDKLTDFEEEVKIEMLLYAGRKQRREIVDENEYVRCAASRLLAHAREELKRLVMEDAESEDEKIIIKMLGVLRLMKEEGKEFFGSEPIENCIAWLEKQKEPEDIIGKAISYFGAESLLDNANGLTDFEKFTAWLYCEFLRGLPKKLNQEYIKEQTKVILDAAQKELCRMPDSTQLIEMWDKEKAMLEEKDFRGDTWRIAYNAFLDGFAKGTCVKFEKQKEPQNKSMAHEDSSWSGILTSPLCKDKNLDDIAQEYVEGVKEYNPTPDWNLIHTAVCYGYHLADQKEQKPVEWSEDDEKVIEAACALLFEYAGYYKEKDMEAKDLQLFKVSQRLKSLRPQPKQGWSEEDESRLDHAITTLAENVKRGSAREDFEFLASLPRRFNLQPKTEWSEEDRRTIDRACVALRAYANGELPDILPSELLEYADKLQSLRPSWKPSEEQMDALDKAIPVCMAAVGREEVAPLESLYEHLKKL